MKMVSIDKMKMHFEFEDEIWKEDQWNQMILITQILEKQHRSRKWQRIEGEMSTQALTSTKRSSQNMILDNTTQKMVVWIFHHVKL